MTLFSLTNVERLEAAAEVWLLVVDQGAELREALRSRAAHRGDLVIDLADAQVGREADALRRARFTRRFAAIECPPRRRRPSPYTATSSAPGLSERATSTSDGSEPPRPSLR